MAQADLDSLLDAVLPFAKDMLQKHGEFYPFGATMALDGTITLAMAHSQQEQPESSELVQMLVADFRVQADNGEVRATGICFDVRTAPPGETEKVDAIRIGLDHRDGESVDVFVPYRKGWFGKVTFGTPYTVQAEPGIFGYRE